VFELLLVFNAAFEKHEKSSGTCRMLQLAVVVSLLPIAQFSEILQAAGYHHR
jgi:hypothetical protein